MKNGNICTSAKSKDRCARHLDDEKFRPHDTDIIQAELSILTILEQPIDTDVRCPCGTVTKRWNYAHHCNFPKHKKWASIIGKPKTLRQWGSNPLTDEMRQKILHLSQQ